VFRMFHKGVPCRRFRSGLLRRDGGPVAEPTRLRTRQVLFGRGDWKGQPEDQRFITSFRKDLMIETVPGIPANLESKFKELGKKEFFLDWLVGARKASGSKDLRPDLPRTGALADSGRSATRQQAFTTEDRDRLVQKLLRYCVRRKMTKP